MAKPQLKDEKPYQKLHESGESPSYEDWSKEDLVARAREIGLQGRSLMTKAQLKKALRSH
jgi:lambda repressor-like predicted transcriptional regulator